MFVFEADIRDFFGSIDHEKLMGLVEQRISDRRVLKLLRSWLGADVLTDEGLWRTVAGTPQGGVMTDSSNAVGNHVVFLPLSRCLGGPRSGRKRGCGPGCCGGW